MKPKAEAGNPYGDLDNSGYHKNWIYLHVLFYYTLNKKQMVMVVSGTDNLFLYV